MICKGCNSRVPNEDKYCVNCGRELRSVGIQLLRVYSILVLSVGAFATASVVVIALLIGTAVGNGGIADRLGTSFARISGYYWLCAAIVQAAMAVFLAFFGSHPVVRTSLVVALVLGALAALAVFGGLDVIALGALVVIVLVVVVYMLRSQRS